MFLELKLYILEHSKLYTPTQQMNLSKFSLHFPLMTISLTLLSNDMHLLSNGFQKKISSDIRGRTQCRELPLCVGSREGC